MLMMADTVWWVMHEGCGPFSFSVQLMTQMPLLLLLVCLAQTFPNPFSLMHVDSSKAMIDFETGQWWRCFGFLGGPGPFWFVGDCAHLRCTWLYYWSPYCFMCHSPCWLFCLHESTGRYCVCRMNSDWWNGNI